MTDIEKKALALANEVRLERGFAPLPNIYRTNYEIEALCRAIEQHEAFRQEVSDVVEQALSFGDVESLRRKGVLSRFIIPKPKPDPLEDVVKEVTWYDYETTVKELRAALDALGFEIKEKGR